MTAVNRAARLLHAAPQEATLPVEVARCLFCKDSGATVVARGRDYEYDTTPEIFDMVRCDGCGLIFIRPRPAPEAMAVIYPANYYAYNEEGGERPIVKRFRDRVEAVKVRRYVDLIGAGEAAVLDAGCGDGRLLDILQRLGPNPWQLAGVEIGEKAARRAAARGFEVRCGDFEFLEFADWSDRFNLVLMHHVIEHTRDPRAAIRKVHGLLQAGGIFSVDTPDTRAWDFRLFRDRYWGAYHIPRHFYLFSAGTLCRLLLEEGFEIVHARSILSPAFWVHSVHNWLVDRSWGRSIAPYFQPQNLWAIAAATALDSVQLATTRQSSNLQVLARKV